VTPRTRLLAIVYDLDGTLLDSAESSYRCFEQTLRGLGVPFDRKRFEATYSPDWYQTYRALGLPEERWPEADSAWVACYEERPSQLVPGAAAALQKAAGRGLRQALVTSGSRIRVERELARHGLDRVLSPIVCSEDVRDKKPHPEGLLKALDELDVAPSAAAYLGDSPEDMEMARRAGVRAVAIPGGFPNRQALLSSEFDHLSADLDEAVELLTVGA
jgi:HAD superfamily hydrolase (TIGR01549 family)